jgi:hypothetical protein
MGKKMAIRSINSSDSCPVNSFNSCQNYESESDYYKTCKKNIFIFNSLIGSDPNYRRLYYHPIFSEISPNEVSNFETSRLYSDVDMDKYMIVDSSQDFLATSSANTCYAICIRGKDGNSRSLIGLCHSSHLMALEMVVSNLKSQMIKEGCLEETLETFVLGGKIVGDQLDTFGIELMKETLNLSKRLNLTGIRFNHSLNPDDSFHVLFTADKIYYSTKKFFKSRSLDCGKDIDDITPLPKKRGKRKAPLSNPESLEKKSMIVSRTNDKSSSEYMLYGSFEKFLEIAMINKKFFVDQIFINPVYSNLSQNPIFERIPEDRNSRTRAFIHLKEQKVKFVDHSERSEIVEEPVALATFSLGIGLAICARGRNKTGKTLKCLEHTLLEYGMTFQEAFDKSMTDLKKQMVEKGCLAETIEFFVLGGRVITDDPEISSLEIQKYILYLAPKYNIVGIQFNPSIEISSGFEVFFTGTSDKIYYCTKPFFNVPNKLRVTLLREDYLMITEHN